MILPILLLFLLLVYALYMLRYWQAWGNIPPVVADPKVPAVFFTVLVPVRNEEAHLPALLLDLERQTYGFENFEVLVIDDHSTDQTPQVVGKYKAQSRLQLSLFFSASFPEKKHKKGALEVGIESAKGEWIVCTDGDCRVPAGWLQALNQLRHQYQPKFISGPVLLSPSRGMFEDLQALEFSALIGVGAASIQQGQPTMCNGANLAYEKMAFRAVNGFEGNDHLASGDDEFLLHKISRQYPDQVAFLKSTDAVVRTSPKADLQQLLQQRVRWASKWKQYESGASKLLALLVLGANLAFFWVLIATLAGVWPWYYLMVALVLKLGPDLLLLNSVLGFFQKKRLLSLIGLLQVVYLPYVLYTALSGLSGKYHWKGRNHRTA